MLHYFVWLIIARVGFSFGWWYGLGRPIYYDDTLTRGVDYN